VELTASHALGGNEGHQAKGVTMVTGNSSASPSGKLTASEWAAITSSLVFLTMWLGISFA
jgi:hypothetical protein